MKKLIIMILLLLLISCQNINTNVCPPIVEYTTEEQDEMIKLIKQNNKTTLNRFLIDYYNLREKIRVCNE